MIPKKVIFVFIISISYQDVFETDMVAHHPALAITSKHQQVYSTFSLVAYSGKKQLRGQFQGLRPYVAPKCGA
jgi:hypothetical protein